MKDGCSPGLDARFAGHASGTLAVLDEQAIAVVTELMALGEPDAAVSRASRLCICAGPRPWRGSTHG